MSITFLKKEKNPFQSTVLHVIINDTHTNSQASHKCFKSHGTTTLFIVNDEFDIASKRNFRM